MSKHLKSRQEHKGTDTTRGLYKKFNVSRMDGRDRVGEKHQGCVYFVLDIDHDPHAIPAIKAYIDSCTSDYPALALDLIALMQLVGRSVPDADDLMAEFNKEFER